MIKDAIAKLADRCSLTEQEAESVMLEIMDGAATSAQIAAYLMGLRLKGETVEELTGSVRAMRAKALRIAVGDPLVVIPVEQVGMARTRLIFPLQPPLLLQAPV